MAFAQSEAYRIFFKMFAGIIFVAILHGMILTPALLGECSFVYQGNAHPEESKEPSPAKEGDKHSQQDTKSVQMATASTATA